MEVSSLGHLSCSEKSIRTWGMFRFSTLLFMDVLLELRVQDGGWDSSFYFQQRRLVDNLVNGKGAHS